MKQTLLERALAIPAHKTKNGKHNYEEIELAVAWLQGRIRYTQIAQVLDTRPSSVMAKMAGWLRDAYQTGRLVIREPKDVE